jgi:acyl-homoserine-lactone acylase
MHARNAIAALAALLLAAPAFAAPRYTATITRTTEGVVHVLAKDMAGIGYGSGYAAAEDNGCIIADALVTVRGERARFFGARARVTVGFNDIPNLDSDFFHRIIGDPARLERAFAATSRDNRALLEGWAAGYNRYLRDHPEGFAASCRGAAWLTPMAHDDMLRLANAGVVQGSSAPYARMIANAAPPAITPAPPPATAPAPTPGTTTGLRLPDPAITQGLGSNGWAFGSAKTVSGRGILVGNPHFPWVGVNRFRRIHLTIPGKLDTMGAALVSAPFVSIGFNKDVAWTHTVNTSQHVAVFSLVLDPADPTIYLVDGKREPMTRREITVAVRDEAPVTRSFYATRYGPMLAAPSSGLGWSRALAFAIRDADQANFRAGDAWLGIARARTVEGIRDVLSRTLGIPYVNTVAADRAGHALYADISAIPDLSTAKLEACALAQGSRPDSENAALFILDGAHSACDWGVDPVSPVPGLMPASELPAMIRTDYVQNSNDSYWLTNPHAPFPQLSPILGPWATRQNLRTRSAIGEIEFDGDKGDTVLRGKIDPAAARTIALANKVEAARLVLADLLGLCPQRPALAPACAALAGWDRRADNDSKGAPLFFAFWRRAAGIKDLWAVPFDPVRPADTPAGLNPAQAPAILDALQAAASELTQLKIPLDTPLGTYQVAPRGAERIAIHGGPSIAGVLNAMNSSAAPEGMVPFHGTSYFQVVTFDEKGPIADSLLAYSQSANPESPHFADATRAYSEKRWLRLPFTPAEIAAQHEGEPLRISE